MYNPSTISIKTIAKNLVILTAILSILAVVLFFLEVVPLFEVMLGLWVGAVLSLVSFRLLILQADKLLNQKKNKVKIPLGGGFLIRMGIYFLCFLVMAQVGLFALLASAIGLSLVGFILKLDGFFSLGSKHSEEGE